MNCCPIRRFIGLGLLTVVAVAAAGCSLVPSSKSSIVADGLATEQVVSMARLAERRGNLSEARKTFKQLVDQGRSLGLAHHRLGVIAARQADLKKAVKHFESARAAGNESADLSIDIAYAKLLLGEKATAERLLSDVIDEEPGNKRALNNLAILRASQGRFSECLAVSRRVVDPAQAHSNVGYLMSQFGDLDAASDNFHIALQKDPSLKIAANALLQLERTNAIASPPQFRSDAIADARQQQFDWQQTPMENPTKLADVPRRLPSLGGGDARHHVEESRVAAKWRSGKAAAERIAAHGTVSRAIGMPAIEAPAPLVDPLASSFPVTSSHPAASPLPESSSPAVRSSLANTLIDDAPVVSSRRLPSQNHSPATARTTSLTREPVPARTAMPARAPADDIAARNSAAFSAVARQNSLAFNNDSANHSAVDLPAMSTPQRVADVTSPGLNENAIRSAAHNTVAFNRASASALTADRQGAANLGARPAGSSSDTLAANQQLLNIAAADVAIASKKGQLFADLPSRQPQNTAASEELDIRPIATPVAVAYPDHLQLTRTPRQPEAQVGTQPDSQKVGQRIPSLTPERVAAQAPKSTSSIEVFTLPSEPKATRSQYRPVSTAAFSGGNLARSRDQIVMPTSAVGTAQADRANVSQSSTTPGKPLVREIIGAKPRLLRKSAVRLAAP